MSKSYLQTEKECFLCRMLYDEHNAYDLHEHHVFEGTANRRMSEKIGAKVWLCAKHHNMSNYGIHFNKGLDLRVKQIAQREYEKTHTREEFMKHIGRNYL